MDESIVNDIAMGEQSVESSIYAAPVDVAIQKEFLHKLRDYLSACYPELLFSMASGKVDVVDTTDIPEILIAQRTLHNHPPYGLVPCIQVSVQYKEQC